MSSQGIKKKRPVASKGFRSMTDEEIAAAAADYEKRRAAADIMLERARELELSRSDAFGSEVVVPDIRPGTTTTQAQTVQDTLLDEIVDGPDVNLGDLNWFMDGAPRVPTFHEYQMETKPTEKQALYKQYLQDTAEAYAKRRYYYGLKRPYGRGYRSKYRSYRRGYRGRRYKRRRYNRYRSGYGGYYDPDTQEWKKGFGPNYGSRLGSALGEGLQSFAEVIGLGEYKVKKNSLMANIDMGTDPPRVKNSMRGEATIIHHREFIGDLFTGAGTVSPFQLQTYSINIGNSLLFPFGAALARNFQEWEPRGIIVELKSTSSDYAAQLALGSMFLAVDYNSLDSPPANKTELENLEYAVSQKPSKSMCMPVECAMVNDVLTHLYVSLDGEYNGGDPRFSDLGKLYVGSFGVPNTGGLASPIAEIWISYEIALFKPHIHGTGAITTIAPYTHFGITNGNPEDPFGSQDDWDNINGLGVVLNNSNNTMSFTATLGIRTYYVRWVLKMTSLLSYSVTSFASATISNGTFLSQFVSPTATLINQDRTPTGISGQTEIFRQWIVEVPSGRECVIGFGDPSFVTSPSFSDADGELWVFLLNEQRIEAV